MSDAQTVIIGAGAIGGTLGAHMTRAGHDVLLVDANEEHLKAMQSGGLTISTSSNFTQAVNAVAPGDLTGPISRAIVAVKTRDTDAALDLVVPRLTDDGTILVMQNGLGIEQTAKRAGAARTIGAAFTFGAYYLEPGHVVFSAPSSFRIGELDGARTERLTQLQSMLQSVQPIEITTNIRGYVWAKIVLGAIYFGTALVNADVPEIYGEAWARDILAPLGSDVADVAEAEGVTLENLDGFDAAAFAAGGRDPDGMAAAWRSQQDYWDGHAQQRTGVWRDLAIHKRKTEIDALLGPVIQRAAAKGVAVPNLERLLDVMHQVERGELPQDWSTLQALAGKVRAL